MPRIARLDALGCVQLVTARGIERRAIFRDDRDRLRFLDLLEGVLRESAAVFEADQPNRLSWTIVPVSIRDRRGERTESKTAMRA